MQDLDYKPGEYVKYAPKLEKPERQEYAKVVEARPSHYTLLLLKDPRDLPALKSRTFWANELVQTVLKISVVEKQVMSKINVHYMSEFVKRYYDPALCEFRREEIEAEHAYMLRWVK